MSDDNDDFLDRARMALRDMQGRVEAGKLKMFERTIEHAKALEARAEKAEAALQAADELAKVAHEVSVDAYGVEHSFETTFHRDVHNALHPALAAYRKARGGEP